MLESAGIQLFRDGQDVLKYNHIYRACESGDKELQFSKLQVADAEGKDEAASQSIQIGWTDLSPVKPSEWSAAFTNDIYDQVLNAAIANQMDLLVFIHFPFYKESAVKQVRTICEGICRSARSQSTRITFIGFGDDMARMIEPGYAVKSPSAKQRRAFDLMRNELGLSKENNRFVFMHNSTMKGISLGMTDSSLVELISQLVILLSSYFDQILPVEAHEVTALGFSSLNFNKYQFATYLLQKAVMRTIDQASVNSTEVDVNKVFDVVNDILNDKEEILSRFYTTTRCEGDNSVHDQLAESVEDIRKKVLKICDGTKDITFKTAILAALLSKTEYGLFSSSVYNASNSCMLDLYSEPVDYFINEDDAGYYKVDGEKAINPIGKIKELDRTIINSETEIRNLEKRLQEQAKNIEDGDKVCDCYIDDEFFHFDDKKFRLLPNVIEEPLQENYVPKPTTKESVDLRQLFTDIKNQGQQGSCLSFTLTSVFEYMMKLSQAQECDLSEAFLYYNARNLDDASDVSVHTDTGSRFKPALDSLTKYGIALEKYCPYNDVVYDMKPSEDAYKDAESRKLIKALNVERKVEDIKCALAEGYPVAASFTLCPSFDPVRGYISMPNDQEIAETLECMNDPEKKARHSRHAMVIVGYSDQLQMFIVRNSWGQDWGDNGYCYIPYAYVAHECLFNFACIITEVASLQTVFADLKTIPALKVDNTDVRIRYYITKAALDNEMSLVEKKRKERMYWLEYFETIKTIFANSNNRDEYVSCNNGKLEADKLASETSIRQAEAKQEELKKDWVAYNKKVLVRLAAGVAAILVVWIGFNALAVKFAEWFDMEKIIHLKYIWMLPVDLVLLVIALISLRSKRGEWLEDRDALENVISRERKKIAAITKKLGTLRFKAFAAWKLMKSLESTQDYFLSYYNKLISLMNNLRAWYAEIRDSNNEMDFSSKFPNISLLDRRILDSYFEIALKDSYVCGKDLCENIDGYEISAEFLGRFKSDFTRDITNRLMKSLESVDFNVTSHVAENSHAMMAKPVTVNELDSLNYQANVFVHLNLQKRGDVAFSKAVFAPDIEVHSTKLTLVTSRPLGIPDYRLSDDKYRMMLVSVASLYYEECEMLR